VTEWVVVVHTVVIAALGFLACGLLRSQAAVLHALDGISRGRRRVEPRRSIPVRASEGDTLLAFLSSDCRTCGGFWSSLRDGMASTDLPAGIEIVVVAKAEEDRDRIAELAGGAVPVRMSTEAWSEYEVPVTPYFVHVHGPSGGVVGQGTGTSWAQVASLLRRARDGD
jgi:hypothetical protein